MATPSRLNEAEGLPIARGGVFSPNCRLYDGEDVCSLPCEGEGWGHCH